MSHTVSDLLEVLLLAKEAGLYDPTTELSSLQPVPLFETVEDLQRAPAVMQALFETPLYLNMLRGQASLPADDGPGVSTDQSSSSCPSYA